MAGWVRIFATKPDDLSLIPRRELTPSSYDLHICTRMHVHKTHTHTHMRGRKINKCKKKLKIGESGKNYFVKVELKLSSSLKLPFKV